MIGAARPVVCFFLVCFLALVAGRAHADELLVGNKSADSVWRLSVRDGRKTGEFRTGKAPHEIAVAGNGRFALVSNYGRETSGNTLSVLDLVGGKPTRSIDLGEHGAPHGLRLLPGDERALATTEGSASLLIVNVGRGVVERVIDVGAGTGHMVALSPDARIAYVTKINAGTLSRIDLASGLKVQERAAGKGAEGVAVSPDGKEVWVTNRQEGSVTVHDPATLAIKRRMSSRGFPIRVVFTADGRHALVTNATAANVAVFDARSKLRVATLDLTEPGVVYNQSMLGGTAMPIGTVVDPVRQRAYVAISGGDRVAVIDTREWKVIDHWPAGREPDALGLVTGRSDR
ncbi:YncE family protein [Pseudoxanthomonas sacheonensis]|uniref:YncE family protein n=1 Tax=Pseudoxanthomonas sacheonensis TaxID=443615 RepID=UPI0013D71C4B|nr:YncE family protein [Pseudoxanthomonas sacheonensis]KAF1707189.1 gluconolaconase [Pseudoxanthomonas sacheonensis]